MGRVVWPPCMNGGGPGYRRATAGFMPDERSRDKFCVGQFIHDAASPRANPPVYHPSRRDTAKQTLLWLAGCLSLLGECYNTKTSKTMVGISESIWSMAFHAALTIAGVGCLEGSYHTMPSLTMVGISGSVRREIFYAAMLIAGVGCLGRSYHTMPSLTMVRISGSVRKKTFYTAMSGSGVGCLGGSYHTAPFLTICWISSSISLIFLTR